MNKITRNIRGIEWSCFNISGTISLSANVTTEQAEAMEPGLAMARDLGMATDVFAGHSEPDHTEVTVQFPAADIALLTTWVAALDVAAIMANVA